MKKKYLILAGVLALALMASVCGCGKDKTAEEVAQDTQTTVEPAEDSGEEVVDLVDMQVSTEKEETNVIGKKTDTATSVTIINKTGSEVAAIYVRPHPEDDDDDEWGDELVQGKFTLKNLEKAVYYFEKGSSSLYDIRITYSEEGKNECFFRKLPLNNIKEISLCMEGNGDSSIPYARYISGNSTKEISTLTEVKQRLGIYDDDDDDDDSYDEEEETYTSTPTPAPTTAPEPTTAPTEDDEDTYTTDSGISAAAGCIGQSLDTLIGICGEPSQSDYEDEPETGETGYHYYDNFTVSTTVDENGNEIVAGIW